MELVEDCYQKKDKDGMIIHANNVLGLILDLDNDLKKKGKNSVGVKLNILLNSEDKLNNLGISKDVVSALNGFRIIRNKKVAHNDLPLKSDIPFIVVVSFVYLAIFFVEVIILNGEVSKKIA